MAGRNPGLHYAASSQREAHNHIGCFNIMSRMKVSEQGGVVWVDSEQAEYLWEDEWKKTTKGEWKRGRVRELSPGTGRRIVMTAYTRAYTPRNAHMNLDTSEALNMNTMFQLSGVYCNISAMRGIGG